MKTISNEAKEALKNKILDKKWSFDEGIMSYRDQIENGMIKSSFEKNGKYHLSYADGSYREVSKTVYEYYNEYSK